MSTWALLQEPMSLALLLRRRRRDVAITILSLTSFTVYLSCTSDTW